MNHFYTLIILLLINFQLRGQFQDARIISDKIDTPFMTIMSDVDGDDDLDVFCSSPGDNRITWYENLDGLGNFGTEQLVASIGGQNTGIFAVDIDGDTDNDLLATFLSTDKVSWFENLDGQGNFGSEIIISKNLNGAVFVVASDLDGDNDMDAIVSSSFGDVITWHENLGAGNFGPTMTITDDVDLPRQIQVADLDGDNDMDVISVSLVDDKVAWYENLDGQGNFSIQKIISDAFNSPEGLKIGDMDGDNDMDVIISDASTDGSIIWFENLDGLGNFSSGQTIGTSLETPLDISILDIDNDNDLDVIAIAFFDNKIVQYKNLDGAGNFGNEQIIDSKIINPTSLFGGDIDGDNKLDIVACGEGNTLVWYKNEISLGVNQNIPQNINIYPNPTTGLLYCDSNQKIKTLEVYNYLGQHILNLGNTFPLDTKFLKKGFYLLKMESDIGEIHTFTFIKD